MIIAKTVEDGNETAVIVVHTDNGKDIFVKVDYEASTKVFNNLKDFFEFALGHENRIIILLEEKDNQPIATKAGSVWAELIEFYNNHEEVKKQRGKKA